MTYCYDQNIPLHMQSFYEILSKIYSKYDVRTM